MLIAEGISTLPSQGSSQPGVEPLRGRGHGAVSDKTRIAVIDDDPSIRRSMPRMLNAAGFEVVVFASAEEFLSAQDIERISCVVSDLRMPGVDGLAVQKALHTRLPHLSMVFVTGHGDVPASVTAMKAGEGGFLEKPVKSYVL